MSVTFLVDLGCHTMKIGTLRSDNAHEDDLFDVSELSTSVVAGPQSKFICDEIPSLMGRQKVTSLS